MTRQRTGLPAVLVAALAAGACAMWRDLPPRLRGCPGSIPSSAVLPAGDLVWHDRVRYRGAEVDAGFSLIAEKRGERLVLVGLDAFGARVFSVTQEGRRIETDARLGRLLQVPPQTVLRDWHAARAAGTESPGSLDIARPECGYTARFVAESRRFLGD